MSFKRLDLNDQYMSRQSCPDLNSTPSRSIFQFKSTQYSHKKCSTGHCASHRQIRCIEHFVPALSLNFFNVSASFIWAWIWALSSCIFFKFSTICRLNKSSLEEKVKLNHWTILVFVLNFVYPLSENISVTRYFEIYRWTVLTFF